MSATFWLRVKESSQVLERWVMRLGIGLAVFVIVGLLIHTVRLPIVWWLFLLLSVGSVPYIIYKRKDAIKTGWQSFQFSSLFSKQHWMGYALLLLFFFNLFTYVSGSFAYPFLEDDDPWTYAQDMKYVALEKTLEYDYFRPVAYIDPYPPAYVMTMAVLHQTSPEAQWTLKFFNSLLISLSFLFFYFMVRRLSSRDSVALASTFVLSMIPSYLSHFIWAHTLIPLFFMVLVYCYMVMWHEDQKWWVVASLLTAAIFLTHTRQVVKIALLGVVFFAGLWYATKKFPWKLLWSALAGFAISLLWWVPNFSDLMRLYITEEKVSNAAIAATTGGVDSGFFFTVKKILAYLPRAFSSTGGTATRPYSFSDFFVAKDANMINQPIGWGIVITLLVIVTIALLLFKYKKLFKEENIWLPIVLGWFVITFLIVNSATFDLPLGIEGFRTWMLLALPVCILAGYGMILLSEMFSSSKAVKLGIIVVLVVAIFGTAGYYKYVHNTSENWPPGGKWTSAEEILGYTWMKDNLPLNSDVFTYTVQNKVVIGFNMMSCVWCESYRAFHPHVLEETPTQVYYWLKENSYEYIAFGGMEMKYLSRTYGANMTAQKLDSTIKEFANSPARFAVAYQNPGFILFEVK